MHAYSYDSVTGEFLDQITCRENPRRDGAFLLPANATFDAPPDALDGHTQVFRDGLWQNLPDNRGQTYWLADGSKHTITEIGETVPLNALSEAPDLRTLEEVKSAKRDEIEALFQTELAEGVEIGGRVYDCDEASQQRMTSAVTLAQTAAGAGFDFTPIRWTLKDNTTHTIDTIEELTQIALAMGAHVQGLFAIRNGHKAAIEPLETIEAVEAYDAAQGWPE